MLKNKKCMTAMQNKGFYNDQHVNVNVRFALFIYNNNLSLFEVI